MKTVLILIVCCGCQLKSGQDNQARRIASLNSDTIDFKTRVQPVFEKNCSPCHFPGGKIYERLPFDKAETIINHEAVIFKRLKKEEDIALIKQYIQQNKAGN